MTRRSVVLLALLLVVFAGLNTHEVGVDYIVNTVSSPMIVVIAVSAAVGFALGALLMHHRDSRNSA